MSTRDIPARIGDLPAIGRPANSALLALDVTTLAQVSRFTKRELLALHGVGPKAARILEQALAEQDLGFREPDGSGGQEAVADRTGRTAAQPAAGAETGSAPLPSRASM